MPLAVTTRPSSAIHQLIGSDNRLPGFVGKGTPPLWWCSWQGVYGPQRQLLLGAVTDEDEFSLNNNRNNNRRRGRGNRNQGGSHNANRIDSRARGNAPQLLDKYKKLAQDAQHNGDRVQAEYYLQFADHYFRVIADNKARQDEARGKRGDDREQANDDDSDDGDDRRRNSRNSRGQRSGRSDDVREGDRNQEGDEIAADEQEAGDEGDSPSPRRARSENRKPRRKPRGSDTASESDAIDAGVLPPAIGGDNVEIEVKPRRRRRATTDEAGDGDDGLQAAG